jgi:hypothetical protein
MQYNTFKNLIISYTKEYDSAFYSKIIRAKCIIIFE